MKNPIKFRSLRLNQSVQIHFTFEFGKIQDKATKKKQRGLSKAPLGPVVDAVLYKSNI
jgi:hypothetical protein